jgi:hypothetical protein
VISHEHSATDARARIETIARLWPRLRPDEQAAEAESVNDAILHDLLVGVGERSWIDDAIMYVTQLQQGANETWALALRAHDTTGRFLFAAGRAYNGDSLRYHAELTGEWWRGRGEGEGLLAAAALVDGDTTAALAAWERQWDAYGRGEARSAQAKVALRQLAVARTRSDFRQAARYAGDAFLTMDHHDGKVSPAVAVVAAQFDTLYRIAYQDSTSDGKTRFLDALYRDDIERTEPIPVARYTGPLLGRTVLLSTMTWVDCGGCRVRDQALDALLKRYASGNVFVLVHHYEVPFVTPGAFDDGAGWTVEHGLTPPPYDPIVRDGPCALMHVNGGCPPLDPAAALALGAPPAPRLYDLMVPKIDSLLQRPALGKMHASARMDHGRIMVAVQIDTMAVWLHPLKLQIVLVEDSLHFEGGNGLRIWRMVPRQFAGDSASGFGFVIPTVHRGTFTAAFDLARIQHELRQKNEWIDRHDDRPISRDPNEIAVRDAAYVIHPARLSVLAFVHDAVTGEVLHTIVQPVSVDLGAS